MNLTDKDIAELLDAAAETLAKSAKLKKDDLNDEAPAQAPVAQEGAPAPEATPAAAPATEAAPAPEANPEMGQSPDAELQGESEDAPLTDEELHQVYSSMDAEELERHFNVIQGVLTAIHGQGGEEASEGQPEMGQEQAPETTTEAAPAEEGQEQAPAFEEEAQKSETFKALKLENDEIKKSIVNLTKVIENMAKPSRKAATSLNKSETTVEPMAKSDVKAELSKVVRNPNLTKTERQYISNFSIVGTDQDKVEEIINKYSGRK